MFINVFSITYADDDQPDDFNAFNDSLELYDEFLQSFDDPILASSFHAIDRELAVLTFITKLSHANDEIHSVEIPI